MVRVRRVIGPVAAAVLLGASVVPLASSAPAVAAPAQPGFQEQVVFSGRQR